jgi:hypothetical protein
MGRPGRRNHELSIEVPAELGTDYPGIIMFPVEVHLLQQFVKVLEDNHLNGIGLLLCFSSSRKLPAEDIYRRWIIIGPGLLVMYDSDGEG